MVVDDVAVVRRLAYRLLAVFEAARAAEALEVLKRSSWPPPPGLSDHAPGQPGASNNPPSGPTPDDSQRLDQHPGQVGCTTWAGRVYDLGQNHPEGVRNELMVPGSGGGHPLGSYPDHSPDAYLRVP